MEDKVIKIIFAFQLIDKQNVVQILLYYYGLFDLMNKKRFPFFCINHKTLSRLELNLKRRLTVVDVTFKDWGMSLE